MKGNTNRSVDIGIDLNLDIIYQRPSPSDGTAPKSSAPHLLSTHFPYSPMFYDAKLILF
jgi:hypothetical protein